MRVTTATAGGGRPLNERELEVAGLIAAGWTDEEIARDLSISVRTAQGHVQRLLSKLDLSHRREIGEWYTRR